RDGLVPPVFRPEAIARLSNYDWPGNVRELANICERLAILHPGRELGEAEVAGVLPGGASGGGGRDGVGTGLPGVPADLWEDGSLTERLNVVERHLIEEALAATGGNVADAARALRTDRPNL